MREDNRIVKITDFEEDLLTELGGPSLQQQAEVISPKDFVFKYCYTIDPHDSKQAIKLIPREEYIEHLIEEWEVNPLLLVAKSRQMMVSWVMCALHLWDCMFHTGRMCFIVSKKEDDAGFARQLSMMSRVLFIYEHLPKELQAKRMHKKEKPACLEFPETHSAIYGVSQDSEALRQYTATRVLWDEMAFHEHATQAYAAVKPTIEGGGALCGVSTPNGKFNLFYDLVHDTQRKKTRNKTNLVEDAGTVNIEERRASEFIMKGMSKYRNSNGYTIVKLHYSADSEKTAEWAKKAKASYPYEELWDQEMELNFTSTEGKRVYPEFRLDTNVAELRPIPHRPIWRGWDFGYGHPACVWSQVDSKGTLNVLAELIGEDTIIQDFADEVLTLSDKYFPGYKFYDAGDPAVRQKSDKSEKTSADILRAAGIRIQTRPTRINDGVNLIRAMCRKDKNGFVGFKVNSTCETIIDGFLGGYTRDDNNEPKKDGFYDHCLDALRYLCVILFNIKSGQLYSTPSIYVQARPTASEHTGY